MGNAPPIDMQAATYNIPYRNDNMIEKLAAHINCLAAVESGP